MAMNIRDWQGAAHQNAVAHNWWEDPPELGTLLALCHSKLSEALEEKRLGRAENGVIMETDEDGYPTLSGLRTVSCGL